MPYLVHRLHLCYFTGGGIEGQDLVGCEPWLSAERRLQYGHYDRLLAELRIEAFFNFMRIPPEMSARHFLTAISSCFATYLTLNTRLINIFTVRTYWKRSSRVV